MDKYTTIIYSPNLNISSKRWKLQPLPDYMRWFRTSELHYLPYEERCSLKEGLWDVIPEIFMPTRILDLCYLLMDNPPTNVMNLIALLAWVTVSEAKQYYEKVRRRTEDTIKGDEERKRWKNHNLYCTKTKAELETLCKSLKIPVTPSLSKHQLVSLVSQKKGETFPESRPLYIGRLFFVPSSLPSL